MTPTTPVPPMSVRMIPAVAKDDTWPGLVQKPLRLHNWVGFLGSWFMLTLGVTLLFSGSMQVMGAGGFCAEGGPYEVEVHCPAGSEVRVAAALPLMAAGVLFGLFLARGFGVPAYIHAWSLLFGIEGIAFLLSAFMASDDVVIGWLVNGFVFLGMSLPPLLFIQKGWPRSVFGRRRLDGRSLVKRGLPVRDAVAIGLFWILALGSGILTATLFIEMTW